MPVTYYVKMIDVWMVFTMTVPFLEVVLHTFNKIFKQPGAAHFGANNQVGVVRVKSVYTQEEEEEMPIISTSKVRMAGRLVLPIGSLLFCVVFWLVGLIQSYSSAAGQDPNMTDCLTIDLN